jgi:hypothetical protein
MACDNPLAAEIPQARVHGYSGNNPTKLRFLRGSDIISSSFSTQAR